MSRSRILIVEDDPTLRSFLREVALRLGFAVSDDSTGEKALGLVRSEHFDIVLSDMKLPKSDGLEILRAARQANPDAEVVLMTAFGTVDLAVQAMKDGAREFLQKPFTSDAVEAVLRGIEEKLELRRDIVALKREQAPSSIVGLNSGLQAVAETVGRIATSESNVLIHGESGVGKELIAREIHRLSKRAARRMVSLHVAAIPDTMIEAELFGYEKGAFTGAVARRIGLLELADGGTLFLDEIGDLSETIQVKLLRFIQERSFRRLGGNDEIEVDVRIVSATHRNLAEGVRTGRFREDLFYRLNVVPITIPPLRDRRQDIPALVEFFVRKSSARSGRRVNEIRPSVLEELLAYDWPGNVRELENVIERAVALAPGSALDRSYLDRPGGSPPTEIELSQGCSLPELLERVERSVIENALMLDSGVKSRAAERLGIKRTTLIEKMNRLGLK